jgi:hypothetical protein
LQAGQWAAAGREAAAGAAAVFPIDVGSALHCRDIQAEALWRGGQADAAVAVWQTIATARQQRGDEAGARAARLRLADARTASGEPADVEGARQAVLAELSSLQQRDALAAASFALAARLAAWRVLDRAADAAAVEQLALGAAELERHLAGFSDPAVRERVRTSMPWHRDWVEAIAKSGDAAA